MQQKNDRILVSGIDDMICVDKGLMRAVVRCNPNQETPIFSHSQQ